MNNVSKGFAALRLELKKEKEKVKQLEAQLNELESNESLWEKVKDNQIIKSRVISQYLTTLLNTQNPTLINAGFTALTPVNRPKNLADAKRLADKIIKY